MDQTRRGNPLSLHVRDRNKTAARLPGDQMVRLLGYFFGIGALLFLLVAGGIGLYVGRLSKDLPDYQVLAEYQPPVTTRVHSVDGALMGEFAKEKRLYLPIQAVPDMVKAAFLSAEDKNFYQHPGIDIYGLARAIATNVQNIGTGKRPIGASTITQQVAKNFLLSSDQTIDRKIKEAILSLRIEQAYSKDRILELYLNEIFFGLNSYGIAGAALTYFDKSVNELTIPEAAYLAALPKGPSNYHPFRQTERAVERRNYVIDQMVVNKYVTADEAVEAKKQPLGVNLRSGGQTVFAAEYFTEEVRREIVTRYGEEALYEGGLSVRTPNFKSWPARRCTAASSNLTSCKATAAPSRPWLPARTGARRSARSSIITICRSGNSPLCSTSRRMAQRSGCSRPRMFRAPCLTSASRSICGRRISNGP
jgi:penicillin-binding protein 1A